MEKEIGRLPKNDTTDIIIRIDDFGGTRGVTIREFVTSERYTGFTKSGVRISPENFPKFKEMINAISEELLNEEIGQDKDNKDIQENKENNAENNKEEKEELPDY